MIKEVRENIANMFSLMERMDRHMTSREAEYNRQMFINEALGEAGQNGRLQPNVFMNVTQDDAAKKRILTVTIIPLYDQDINAILKSPKYQTDTKVMKVHDKRGNGISLVKYLPLKEKKVKADATAADVQNADTATDTQQQATQAQGNPVTPQKKTGGLLGKLAAKKAAQAQSSDNNGVVTEGLLSKLGAKANGGQAPQVQQPAATPQQNAAPSQANAPATPTVQAQSDDVMNWLKSYYLDVVNIIARNKSYDPNNIAKLKDIANLYSIYRATPTNDDKIYVEKSSNEMKSEIAKAIAQGNWADVLRANINPLNLESLIFGNVLTLRNQHAVTRRAAEAGINQGDPNYPTLVMAPGSWAKFCRRKIVDNPVVAYPLVAPRVTDRGSIKQGSGTKGHYDAFGTNNDGFQHFLGYDISDTEPIDPTDTTDYINGELPGILNNLTGELNQAAINYKDAALAAKQANLSDDQKQLVADAQTAEGQARIFNGALISYVERFGLQIQLTDVSNSTNPVSEYAMNVLKIAKKSVEMAGYANPSIADPMAIITAFGIGCYTIGSDEILKIGNSQTRNTVNSLSGDWNKYADSVISSISGVIRYVYNYLNAAYNPINGGNNDNADPNLIVVATANDGQNATQGKQPINESKVKKDIFDTIDDILNDL